MDKNTITGLLLMGLLFLGFTIYNSKQQEKWLAEQALIEAEAARQDSIYRAQNPEPKIDSLQQEAAPVLDSLGLNVAEVATYGVELARAMHAPTTTMALENEVMRVELSSLGAQVKDVTLKNYTKYAPEERTEPVRMFDPSATNFDLEFYIKNGYKSIPIHTSEFVFTEEPLVKNDSLQRAAYRLQLAPDAALRFVYTLYNTQSEERDYLLDFDIELENMRPLMANQTAMLIDWNSLSYQNEKGFKNENMYTTIAYRFPESQSIEELGMSEGSNDEQESTQVNWVAFKQQFFASVLVAHDNFTNATMEFQTMKPGSGYVKEYTLEASIPYTPQTEGYNFSFYYGPNQYSILKKVVDAKGEELQLERMIPLGWGIFGWVNRWFVIPVFDLLHNTNLNFGIIILILVILVKLVILPLTYKSYVSMAKMRLLKPELDLLAQKYPKQEDAMKRQQATMELYKKTGISPMGGCIPMLVQMPILIAMFRFFPASIELRGQSFLWADDLSAYDSILDLPFKIPFYGDHISLFTLLMTLALFLYSWMNYQQTAASQPQQMPGMKFMMLYMMPLMMLFWFNDYASGLCYYYFLSNLLTMGQTFLIRHFVDDTKIQALMAANAAKRKNQKKSKFQQRYEELLRQQELQQQQQQKKK